jgi:parallel beta-helix repeat protein
MADVKRSGFDLNRTGQWREVSVKLFFTVAFWLFSIGGYAANYYVNSLSGSDSNSGTSESSSWKTLAKVNSFTFKPGDQILFKRGGVWREQLKVPSSGSSSNPIVFGAYGSGNNPVIDGADIISSMTSAGSNIWQKTGVTTQPNLMYLNGTVGSPKTSLGACTSEGDWYYNSVTDILYVYSNTNPSGNVELGQRKRVIDLGSRHYIIISNLTIQHSNELNNPSFGIDNTSGGISATTANSLTIIGCTIQKNGIHGLYIGNSSDIIIKNSTFLRNGESHNTGDNVRIYATTTGTGNIIFADNISSYCGSDGVRILGSTKANHITNIDIYGNTFNNNIATGLYVQKSDSVAIYNNTFDSNGDEIDAGEDYSIGISSVDNLDVYNNTITNHKGNDAIQVYSDATARWGSSHNVSIYRNYISGVKYGDCIGIGIHHDQTCQNLKIYYNTLISADGYGIVLYHHDAGTARANSVDVFNNTVYGNIIGGIYLTADFPVVLKNNIFVDNGAITNVNASKSTTGLKTSNNLYYQKNGYVLRYKGNKYTTATIKNFEASAQNTNPMFTNATNGDLSLQAGSPAINAGVNVGLTHDILGNPIVGAPDIGAYEYGGMTDIISPVVTEFKIPATASSLTVAVSSFTATDDKAVTGYLITGSSTAPLAENTGWTATAPDSFTFFSEGTKKIYAWAKDAEGNVSASVSAVVAITLSDDGTKPVVTAFTIPATASSLTVAVSSFTATDNIAVTGYLITGSSTAPLAENTGWTATAPDSFTFFSEGTKKIYAWAKDAEGNVSASVSAVVAITLSDDGTKPVVTAFTIPATASSLTVAVSSFTATDNIAVTGYLITGSSTAPLAENTGWTATAPDSFTFFSEGTKKIYAWAKDAEGNVSASVSAVVAITLSDDGTKPVVTAFTIPATASSLTVAVSSFTATDNIAVTGYLITGSSTAPLAENTGWTATAPDSFTFFSEGTKKIYAWAKDAEGNVSASVSAVVAITLSDDGTKPVVTAFTIPATASSLTVAVSSFTATDDKAVTGYLITGSSTAPLAENTGWTATAPDSFTFFSEGTKKIYAWAKDAEGNVSASVSAVVAITLSDDGTKPVVTAFTIPATASSLTVAVSSFTATDDKAVTGYLITGSSTAPLAENTGWTATAPDSFTFFSEGTKKIYAWAKDAEGNVSASVSAVVAITTPTKSAETSPEITTIIEKFDLKVYPNPFMEKLHFEFVSPESCNVRIDLYDITGRRVQTIFEQPILGGVNYKAEFRPEAAINAIYIYRLTMGDAIYNGKLIFKKD